ncbi:MAG: response regulator [Pseudomonadota bacterium]
MSSVNDSVEFSTDNTDSNQKLRLLLADDSRIVRVAVQRILADQFDLIEADDGESAWNLLTEDESIDVLLTDLHMPKLDGYELIGKIRAPENPLRLRNLPVMVLSGNDDMAERDRAIECGATDYVTKPFDTNQITARVEALARQARQQQEELRHSGAKEDTATVDPLTGLSNRAYFEHHGAKDLSFTQRHSKDLSIILIRVDNIEGLIEDVGPGVVDQLLQKLGEFLAGSVRTLETVARIAPHKFGVIAPMTNDIGVLELANRIMKKVHKTVFRNSSGEIRFTVSMGLASPRVHLIKNFEQLVDIAERRLGLAVENGGDCIVHEDALPRKVEQEPVAAEAPPEPAAENIKKPKVDSAEPLPDSNDAPPIETALWLLQDGQGEHIRFHYKTLLTRLLPLLEHADECWSLGIDDAVVKLKDRLALKEDKVE